MTVPVLIKTFIMNSNEHYHYHHYRIMHYYSIVILLLCLAVWIILILCLLRATMHNCSRGISLIALNFVVLISVVLRISDPFCDDYAFVTCYVLPYARGYKYSKERERR